MNTSLVTWCAGPAGDGAGVIAVGTSRARLADGASCGTKKKIQKKKKNFTDKRKVF